MWIAILDLHLVTFSTPGALDTEIEITVSGTRVVATASLNREILLARIADQVVHVGKQHTIVGAARLFIVRRPVKLDLVSLQAHQVSHALGWFWWHDDGVRRANKRPWPYVRPPGRLGFTNIRHVSGRVGAACNDRLMVRAREWIYVNVIIVVLSQHLILLLQVFYLLSQLRYEVLHIVEAVVRLLVRSFDHRVALTAHEVDYIALVLPMHTKQFQGRELGACPSTAGNHTLVAPYLSLTFEPVSLSIRVVERRRIALVALKTRAIQGLLHEPVHTRSQAERVAPAARTGGLPVH